MCATCRPTDWCRLFIPPTANTGPALNMCWKRRTPCKSTTYTTVTCTALFATCNVLPRARPRRRQPCGPEVRHQRVAARIEPCNLAVFRYTVGFPENLPACRNHHVCCRYSPQLRLVRTARKHHGPLADCAAWPVD